MIDFLIENKFKLGLGDQLVIFYLFENIGRQKNIFFNLKTINTINIFEHFDFNYIKPGESNRNLIEEIDKKTFLKSKTIGDFNGQIFIIELLDFLIKEFNYELNESTALSTCLKNKEPKNNILVQFDGRTCMRQKREIPYYVKNKILSRLENFYHIGGPDTKINSKNIKIGNLEFLIKEMKSASLFLGCDSGMSHLAGVLGIKSIIYLGKHCDLISPIYDIYQNHKVIKLKFLI